MDPIVLFQLTFTFIYSTVRFRDTQAHLDLGFQLDNMAYTIPKPNSQATLKPSELKDFHQFIPPIPFRLHSVNCFPRKKVIARIYNLSAARQCLGGILMPSMSTGVGTSFKAILAMFHSHLTTHLRLMTLDLPLH